MDRLKNLTNESLTKMFSDNFSLALMAIEFAQSQIRLGKDIQLNEIFENFMKHRPDKDHDKKE